MPGDRVRHDLTPSDPVTAYARDVTDGRIIAGRLVRLACERHLRDCETGRARGLIWSPEHAQHALDFFARFLQLPDGPYAGEPFILQSWALFTVGSLYGWFNADGYRRFRVGYIETAKGSGKTPVGAGLCVYAMVADGAIGAQCFVAAGSRDQAHIPFRDCQRILGPELRARLEVLEHNIAMPETGAFIRPVSSEARTLDGKRVHFALLDELHEHRSHEVVTKMRAGTKGNRNSLLVEITNSGYDRLSVCWEHHTKSRQILEGVIEDDEWFAYICGLDPCEACRLKGAQMPDDECPDCDDWRDEATWVKANPLLGITIPYAYLRSAVRNAIDMPSNQDMIKRLNFCIWTSRHLTWIPADRWRAGDRYIQDDDLVGMPCYAGLDLGQTDDFSAFALLFTLPDGRIAVRMRYWIPEATLRSRPARPYTQWRQSGSLCITEGEVSDPDVIEHEVADLCRRWGVRELAYDRRFAEQMRLHLEGQGIVCVDTPQGYALNEAIRTLEALVKSDMLCHGGDPILAWMVGNVAVKTGARGEVRLDKASAADKIDGVVALVMALDRAIRRVEAPTPMVTAL